MFRTADVDNRGYYEYVFQKEAILYILYMQEASLVLNSIVGLLTFKEGGYFEH